jgi:hypothetical protein
MPEDSVETEIPDVTDTSSSSTGSESDSAGASHVDASQDASSPPAGTSPDAPAQAAHDSGEGDPGQQDAETKSTSGDDASFQKRYLDTRSAYNRTTQENQALKQQFTQLQQELHEMRQQFAGVKPEEVNDFRSSRALKPWDPQSPDHQSFKETVAQLRQHERVMARVTDPEMRKALNDAALEEFGPDRLKTIEAWRADVRNPEYERQLNPRAYLQKMIREESQPVVRETLQSSNQQYQQALQGKQAAESWMANKEVATQENVQKVLKYMSEHKMPFDVASAIVERDHFKSQVSNAHKAKQSAEEKERLLQGNASGAVSRNPSASKKLNVAQHLREKGISGRATIDELMNLDQQGLL